MFIPHPKRFFLIALAMSSILGSLWGCTAIQRSPSHQLGAAEVRDLFVDHTVTSRNLNTGTKSVSYYDPDGTVRQIRSDRYRTGHWRIRKSGEICLQMERNQESCRFIKLDADNIYRKYRHGDSGLEPIIVYDAPDAFVRGERLPARRSMSMRQTESCVLIA
ncbi:MAG: hypothetical protein KDJ38_10100 [Gammaproteobacteria bacterium]|nr:hypothetical protein [Gammaproteobacteria bacterium]